jgi:hypothetical protein
LLIAFNNKLHRAVAEIANAIKQYYRVILQSVKI